MNTLPSTSKAKIRDRVIGLIRIPAGELAPNPANWRRRPKRQRAALRGLLRQIGYADALLARRDKDRLILIDGHLRQSLDPDQVVPVLVLDLDEQEAEVLRLTLDPLAAWPLPTPSPCPISWSGWRSQARQCGSSLHRWPGGRASPSCLCTEIRAFAPVVTNLALSSASASAPRPMGRPCQERPLQEWRDWCTMYPDAHAAVACA